MDSSKRHAEVAGAGIAGLAVAIALAQRGWTVTVHERFPSVREVGAGIALGRNAVEALAQLGAFEEAVADGQEIASWSIGDEWGNTLQDESVGERTMYSCRRESLQRALLRSALREGVAVVTGSGVVGVRDGDLVTEDGARHKADLIVGADGVGSRVRRSLQDVGIRTRRVDLKVASLRFMLPRIPGDPVDTMPEWISGNRRVGLLPFDDETIAMYMFCPPGDGRGRALPVDVASWTSSFPHLRAVFDRLPKEGTWLPVVETRNSTWTHDNAVLLGDAAFSMAPNMGQGGSTALHAAITLANAVSGERSVADALKRWESNERDYVDYVQTWSRRYSRMVSQWPPVGRRLRSLVFRGLSRSKRLAHRFAGIELRHGSDMMS
ncbi:NAD(P)/FAD-dependent oxidoreductase [Okibacterium endophyticum]